MAKATNQLKLVGQSILDAQILQTITGTVTSQDGELLIGSTVQVKGTSIGDVTDEEGKYQIDVPDEATTLVFSYIGYQTQEVAIDGRSVINAVLQVEVSQLDEIVVVGYGTATKRDLTGAVHKVNVEDSPLALQPTTNVLQLLQGSTPGVNIGAISSAGGTPGLLIRGRNSISASNAPLIVLDGVIYDGGLSQNSQ